ncbi:MAG TPA: AtpZ/AtpI family protein [Desulfomonilia bacterium]|nr:AtpZ/AtpI family protein [Desulfomonilia bacterium]
MKRNEPKRGRINNLNELLTFVAWGAVLVIASFVCMFVGQWMDAALDTGPFFMIGLFILAIFLIIARLYVEFSKASSHMGGINKRHA